MEGCAEFLDIPLADNDGYKLYTKASLAIRIVSGLFALLPSTCNACKEVYTVDHEPDEPPPFTCLKCFQGSHSCDAIKAVESALQGTVDIVQAGFVWLCSRCLSDVNPLSPRKTKLRLDSASQSQNGSRPQSPAPSLPPSRPQSPTTRPQSPIPPISRP